MKGSHFRTLPRRADLARAGRYTTPHEGTSGEVTGTPSLVYWVTHPGRRKEVRNGEAIPQEVYLMCSLDLTECSIWQFCTRRIHRARRPDASTARHQCKRQREQENSKQVGQTQV